MGIAFFSYDGVLSIGLGADWQAVEGLHLLAEDFDAAFDELQALAHSEKGKDTT